MPLLPKKYLDAVVSIEIFENNDFHPIATGFLVGFSLNMKDNQGKELFKIFLVTNKHVFNNETEVWLRFNKGPKFMRYKINLVKDGKQVWLTHENPNVDIGVIHINANKLDEDGIQWWWFPEELMAFSDKIEELDIMQGDEIFTLGFPMGITGEEKNYVIVRGGIISRLDEEIINKTSTFLIDSFVFPGNSGGPVIIKPSVSSLVGTKPVKTAYLIGVIKGYKVYTETAYSLQSNPPEPRVVFRENSGLTSVVPLDYVRDIVQKLLPKKELTDQEKKEMTTEEKNTNVI